MTEQHSPEYIKYMRSDEAQCLQKLWHRQDVKAGQSCVCTMLGSEGILGLVHRHLTKDTQGKPLTGWVVSEVRSGKIHWYCNKTKHISEDWAWLPTLWQLVKMIEGTGYRVGFSTDYESATRLEYLYWLSAQCAGLPYVDAKSTDLMLAAAKLAVRAVEG